MGEDHRIWANAAQDTCSVFEAVTDFRVSTLAETMFTADFQHTFFGFDLSAWLFSSRFGLVPLFVDVSIFKVRAHLQILKMISPRTLFLLYFWELPS